MVKCDKCGDWSCYEHSVSNDGGQMCDHCSDTMGFIDYMEQEYDRECREKDVAPCTMKKYGEPPCGECDCCKEFESR